MSQQTECDHLQSALFSNIFISRPGISVDINITNIYSVHFKRFIERKKKTLIYCLGGRHISPSMPYREEGR